jgi:hypothetical protein
MIKEAASKMGYAKDSLMHKAHEVRHDMMK